MRSLGVLRQNINWSKNKISLGLYRLTVLFPVLYKFPWCPALQNMTGDVSSSELEMESSPRYRCYLYK